SSVDYDGLAELVLDNTPPTESPLSFVIKSTPDTSEIPKVDISFTWRPSSDRVSGLRGYRLEMFAREGSRDTMLFVADDIPPTDTSLVISGFELSDYYFATPIYFRLIPMDYAGNENTSVQEYPYNFFQPPELRSAQWIGTSGKIELTWTKVPGADQYIVVWMTDKSFFSEDLRNSAAQREILPGLNTQPDVISDTLNRTFNPNSRWIFRMLAVKEDKFESGWSNFLELEPMSGSGGNGGTITDVEESEVPKSFALYQNYPNPFNPATTIQYDLPKSTLVELSIYNLKGQKVRTLVQGVQEAGRHQAVWDGRNFSGQMAASGLYLIVFSTPEFHQVKKCLLMK
ncbi:MAG TPA: T9SS type A sorting domain-containing protein, partial [Bacteroidetes bacterium]|nr:T9SS type A sorting domain-containing protein [Bacteroidota bacterium]